MRFGGIHHHATAAGGYAALINPHVGRTKVTDRAALRSGSSLYVSTDATQLILPLPQLLRHSAGVLVLELLLAVRDYKERAGSARWENS